MPINEWWAADPDQRFWMEITDRADLGADLFAPTTDGSGKPYWGYELITYVQPGDVILHWHKALAGEPAIVGWSRAVGAYEDADISWQAHSTVGRSRGKLDLRPAWRMPLVNYTPLSEPVLISDVRAKDAELRKVLTELEVQNPGGSLYFPFGFSDKRELRAQQTYFVKMPREVLDVLSVGEVGDGSGPSLPTGRGKAPKMRGSGYIADAAVRSAIEWRAVNLAVADYQARGYAVEYTGSSQPYDLAVQKGPDRRRVEVKGSLGAIDTVELTVGEVENSRGAIPTDLFVVDGIQWQRGADGSVRAVGGDARCWKDWTARRSHLTAIRYRYELPRGGILDQ
ncbi:protein NO VEIN domain-containing protein [Promicromonospora kroppenstedtii]|uniref:Protein NO VEIN domain-containing protein n=1 Tax=Promicromonospora kroppenstedtii TaxID=440482 RepID=A0ABW7XHA0_9MICO